MKNVKVTNSKRINGDHRTISVWSESFGARCKISTNSRLDNLRKRQVHIEKLI